MNEKMRFEYQHNLKREEVYLKVNSLLEKLQEQYRDKISTYQKCWNPLHDKMDFSLDVKGFKMNGQVSLTDKKLIIEAKVPFAVKIFSGKIEGIIEEYLDNTLC